jgi:hypothetical protein
MPLLKVAQIWPAFTAGMQTALKFKGFGMSVHTGS